MTTSPVLSITDELLADIVLECEDSDICQFGEYRVALPTAQVLALVEHIRSLTERLEMAEKDAGRYRWLRRHVGVLNDGYSTIWLPSSRTQIDANDEAETGDAIDAAIAQEGADHE